MSAPLHSHTIVESVSHEGRATTVVTAAGLGVRDDEHDEFLTDLIELLQKTLESIPEEHRASAVVQFRAYGDYASMSVDVAFTRPETDAELADRNRWLKSLDQDDEDRDRREFARLQAKFQKLE